jgi:MSHA biogenesis protein MshJ
MVYLDKVETLHIREKVLIGLTVGILLVSMMQFFFVDPRLASTDRLNKQLRSLTSNNERLASQLDSKLLMPNQNRRVVLSKEADALQLQLNQEQSQIRKQTASLVPANQVPVLLQSLLSKELVELVALKNIAPVPIIEEGSESGGASVQLYRHGIELQIRGSYHELRRYLMAMEQQSWKLLWHAFHLETESNGSSLMRLEVQTLSTDNVWIGV